MKITEKILLLLAVAFAGVGCGPPDAEDIYYDSVWYVKNATSQTLLISPAPFGQSAPYSIAAGAKATFYSRGEYFYISDFWNMMVIWRGKSADEISFDVSDSSGALLKSWKSSAVSYDDYDDKYYYYASGDKFFNSSSWIFSYDYKRKKKKDRWTFEITEEDIAQ